MNNYCGGPTWLQWVKQVLDKINEVVERINILTSDVMNVRQLPSGGSHGQVATPTEDGSGYEWVDQSGGGGGTGDVTSRGDNTFTGMNTFTQPVTVGEGTSPNHAARVHQVTELGNEVNVIAGASVTKDNAQTITGVKTFAVSPKVPNPTAVGDATPKSYVDNEVDTASSETLNAAKAYADGLETKIKNAAVNDIEAADNVFTGNNTFANPVSVGTPTLAGEAATKRYVDEESSVTLNEAKTYADGMETKIKDAVVNDIKAADNVFTGNNTFANPVSVGTPTLAGEAATKGYVDDADGAINANIAQLSESQSALQEEVQQIQSGTLGRMNAATTADKDKVWTSTEANPSGEFVTPTGGGVAIPESPTITNRYLRTKDNKGNLEWGYLGAKMSSVSSSFLCIGIGDESGEILVEKYLSGFAQKSIANTSVLLTKVYAQYITEFTRDINLSTEQSSLCFRASSPGSGSHFALFIYPTPPVITVDDVECKITRYYRNDYPHIYFAKQDGSKFEVGTHTVSVKFPDTLQVIDL